MEAFLTRKIQAAVSANTLNTIDWANEPLPMMEMQNKHSSVIKDWNQKKRKGNNQNGQNNNNQMDDTFGVTTRFGTCTMGKHKTVISPAFSLLLQGAQV